MTIDYQPKITTASQSLPFHQYEYPKELYKFELSHHNKALQEYPEVFNFTINNANLQLYQQQPYLSFGIRVKLIEFLLKMSVRLKILPFVFYRAVKIFDRYCSKRIILLDQSQLIITTCLWIASKVQGGNNHFVNLSNCEKLSDVNTITDLGYGSGGKYLGPTERFRLPKLHELIKLCGNKCNYDASMFKQMELHILNTLNWSFNDLSIEDLIVKPSEFNLSGDNEFFKIKEYLSYISLYSTELIDMDMLDVSTVIVDLINECFNLNKSHYYYQTLNVGVNCDASEHLDMQTSDDGFFIEGESDPFSMLNRPDMDYVKYKFIKKNLIQAILKSSEFILRLFNSKGPQFLYDQVVTNYNANINSQVVASKVSVAPQVAIPMSPSQAPLNPDIYKPVPLKYFTHHHNNSALSVNSSNNLSIFDIDTRRLGVRTPISDEESPVYIK